MQQTKRETCFRVWALFLKSFSFLPIFMVLDFTLTGRYDWPEFGKNFGGIVFSVLFGAGCFLLLRWYEKKHPRKTIEMDREVLQNMPRVQFDGYIRLMIALYVLSAAVYLIVCLLLWQNNPFYGVVQGVLFYLCWVRIFLSVGKDYTDIYSLLEYVIAGFFYIAGIISVYLIPLEHSGFHILPITLAFIFLTVSAGFLLNQSNLDRTMDSMQHSKASLPQKVRLYNMFLIGGIMVLLVIGLLFYRQIVDAFVWLVKLFRDLLIVVVNWLSSIFAMGGMPGVTDESETTQNMGTTLNNAMGENQWLNLLFLTVVAVFVVLILTKFGRRWLRQIRDFLSRGFRVLLGKFSPSSVNSAAGRKETVYYSDFVEDLHDSGEENIRQRKEKRSLRKQVKNWRALNDPTEKVRRGYLLLLSHIRRQDQTITTADTVEEVRSKLKDPSLSVVLEAENPLYERVRYHMDTPSQKDMEEFCDRIEQAAAALQKR